MQAGRSCRGKNRFFLVLISQFLSEGRFQRFACESPGRLVMGNRAKESRSPSHRRRSFEMVLLDEILRTAGMKFGKEPRVKILSNHLLMETEDGYRVVFALWALHPTFSDTEILFADSRDGQPLEKTDGSVRLIIPHEKRSARWVRRIVDLPRVGLPQWASSMETPKVCFEFAVFRVADCLSQCAPSSATCLKSIFPSPKSWRSQPCGRPVTGEG